MWNGRHSTCTIRYILELPTCVQAWHCMETEKKYIDAGYIWHILYDMHIMMNSISIYQDFPSDIFFSFAEYYSAKGQIISEKSFLPMKKFDKLAPQERSNQKKK